MPDGAAQRADGTARGMVQGPGAAIQGRASEPGSGVGGMVHHDPGDGARGRARAHPPADHPHLQRNRRAPRLPPIRSDGRDAGRGQAPAHNLRERV